MSDKKSIKELNDFLDKTMDSLKRNNMSKEKLEKSITYSMDAQSKESAKFDNYVIYTNGGALLLSINFIDRIVKGQLFPIDIVLLSTAWVFFLISLFLTIISIYNGIKANHEDVESLIKCGFAKGFKKASVEWLGDKFHTKKMKNRKYALAFMGGGIFLMALFSASSLYRTNKVMTEKNNPKSAIVESKKDNIIPTGIKEIIEGAKDTNIPPGLDEAVKRNPSKKTK